MTQPCRICVFRLTLFCSGSAPPAGGRNWVKTAFFSLSPRSGHQRHRRGGERGICRASWSGGAEVALGDPGPRCPGKAWPPRGPRRAAPAGAFRMGRGPRGVFVPKGLSVLAPPLFLGRKPLCGCLLCSWRLLLFAVGSASLPLPWKTGRSI